VAFVHRFGSCLNSHIHIHVVVTEGVFSEDPDGTAVFHPVTDLRPDDLLTGHPAGSFSAVLAEESARRHPMDRLMR
jgi:hypothetical protein